MILTVISIVRDHQDECWSWSRTYHLMCECKRTGCELCDDKCEYGLQIQARLPTIEIAPNFMQPYRKKDASVLWSHTGHDRFQSSIAHDRISEFNQRFHTSRPDIMADSVRLLSCQIHRAIISLVQTKNLKQLRANAEHHNSNGNVQTTGAQSCYSSLHGRPRYNMYTYVL